MPEFSFNIVAGSRCGKHDHGAPQFVLGQCDAGRLALHFTILGASPRYQRDGISGAQLPAPFRRIGIIINRKSPRLEGTSAWVRRGAADSGTLRAQRWRPRERLTSIGRENYLPENRRRLEHRDPRRVASLIHFPLNPDGASSIIADRQAPLTWE